MNISNEQWWHFTSSNYIGLMASVFVKVWQFYCSWTILLVLYIMSLPPCNQNMQALLLYMILGCQNINTSITKIVRRTLHKEFQTSAISSTWEERTSPDEVIGFKLFQALDQYVMYACCWVCEFSQEKFIWSKITGYTFTRYEIFAVKFLCSIKSFKRSWWCSDNNTYWKIWKYLQWLHTIVNMRTAFEKFLDLRRTYDTPPPDILRVTYPTQFNGQNLIIQGLEYVYRLGY